jgi:hypothetical protein
MYDLPRSWDEETDVVVVGGGFAALVAAATAHARGAQVVVLEAADVPGGIMRISSGEYWIPNNRFMREQGIEDPRDRCLQLMARLSYPTMYDPESPTLGVPARAYRLFQAYYDTASPAVDDLAETGAMPSALSDGVTPDAVFNPLGHIEYHEELEENAVQYGRALMAATGGLHGPGQGQSTVDMLMAYCDRVGIPVRLGHRVDNVFARSDGAVVGVAVTTDGGPKAIRARKGVVFGSGGFYHNENARTRLLRGTVWGATAPYTNTGVFLQVAQDLGAMTENTDSMWWGEMAVEEVLTSHRSNDVAFWLWGDSMVAVNRYGVRVVNEKAHYNERGRVHTVYDASTKSYENNILFQVYDHALSENPEMGVKYPVPYQPGTSPYIITGDTWEDLAANIDDRLAKISSATGGVRLADGFASSLADTVTRFNSYAESGVDPEFHRGERQAEHGYSVLGLTRGGNRTMYPFASSGPYYAVMLGAAGFDTNGGPSINEHAQVIDSHEDPIPGLYGAGNAIGSPAHGAYWSGGATLGNALVWAHAAGQHVAAEPVKDV